MQRGQDVLFDVNVRKAGAPERRKTSLGYKPRNRSEKWGKNIQTAGYNVARTVCKLG